MIRFPIRPLRVGALDVSIDFETFSECDLKACGHWRYAEDRSTEALCAAIAIGDDEPEVWLPGMPFPYALRHAEAIHAWHAEFEVAIWLAVCRRRYGWPDLDLRRVRCSMATAQSFGLPGALDKASGALSLEVRKDPRGASLIRRFCVPRNPTKHNPSTRILPTDDPENFAVFSTVYCPQDVCTERAVLRALPRPHLPDDEQATYLATLRSNQRGVKIDRPSVDASIAGFERYSAKLEAEQRALTTSDIDPEGISKAHLARLHVWLAAEGAPLPNLQAQTVEEALENDLMPERPRRVLEIRQSLGQTSVTKFHAMRRSVCRDGGIHGMLQYHGAGTGRWAGKLVQLQNLKKPDEDLGSRKGGFLIERWIEYDGMMNPDVLELFGDPMSFFSAYVRPCLIASPGKVLLVADFNAIECRVLAWLAGELWLLETFQNKGDVYIVQASDLYGRPITKENDPVERDVGKRIVLGCGYQMAAKKFRETSKKYGAPCTEEFAENAVNSYRRVNRRIVNFWYRMQDAAVEAIESPGLIVDVGRIAFRSTGRFLQMRLPSGRLLTYWYPRIEEGLYGPRIVYFGLNPKTKQWGPQDTYGGRLVENATQAVARDLCRDAILRVEAHGYDYLFSSHDEIVSEVEWQNASVDRYCALMAEVPAWADGCPISAEGWEGQRYRK